MRRQLFQYWLFRYKTIFPALIIICILPQIVLAQVGIVRGVVTAGDTKETLMGVTIASENNKGTISDSKGRYHLILDKGEHILSFSFLGYDKQQKTITLKGGDTVQVDILLVVNAKQLDMVVVSVSKYEKKVSEETVSMDVLKPSFIENTNSITMDEAVDKAPGVNVIDGQANIRGGGGYSYGAGSRVLVLVDDIPELAGDAGDVKWNFLPTNDIDQVEIIKGASSVLYGSSALDGVINIRTAYPTDTPRTKINFYQGIYQNPQRKELIWWGNDQPNYTGGNFMHSQKFGQFDLVFGGNVYNQQSFRQGEFDEHGSFNIKTRYRFKKIEGLSIGLNTNYLYAHTGTFFIWANDSSGGYRPFGGTDSATTTLTENKYHRLTVDPFIIYHSKSGDTHSLKMRFYQTTTNTTGNKSTSANFYYAEYQYQHLFKFGLHLTAGATANFTTVVADLYGNHNGNNEAAFVQLDEKIGRLSIVGGARYELYRLDTATGKSDPVLRAGMNFTATKSTHLRASIGQGYRFPSMAEKFINTSLGDLHVFPNPDVQPEKGWTAETGINQALKFGNVEGYIDGAAFYSRYSNFMQFTFDFYPPYPYKPGDPINVLDLPKYLGFKSVNLEDAEIKGIELTTYWQADFGKVKVNLSGGITFMDPIDLGQKRIVDSTLAVIPHISSAVKDSLEQTTILKYRYKRTAKINGDVSYKKFSTGFSLEYNSFMVNVDPIFEGESSNPLFALLFQTDFPIVKAYRQEHDKGTYLIDWRFSFDINKNATVSFIIKNLLNTEYTVRPAMIEEPREFSLMVGLRF